MEVNDNSQFRSGVLKALDLDILCLSETFLRSNEELYIDSYNWYGINRTKIHNKAKRGSGGVGVLIHNRITSIYGVQVLPRSREGAMWLKFDPKTTGETFCVCICYMPPKGSNHQVQADVFFEDLLQCCYEYQNEGKLVICGDLNARCGDQADHIEGVDSIPGRKVMDLIENEHGDLLVDFLINNNMCMLNGRKGNGGEFTCVSTKGKSMVDYVCVAHEQLHLWNDLKVWSIDDLLAKSQLLPPEKLPDHLLLTWDFSASVDITTPAPMRTIKKYNTKNIPETFMDSRQDSIKERISQIESLVLEQAKLDEAYDSFVSLIHSEMDTKLESKSVKLSSAVGHKSKYKPYWNDALQKLWDNTKAKENIWRHSKGTGTVQSKYRQEYCSSRKHFDRALRREKRKYKKSEQLHLLDLSESDQALFWQEFGKIGIASDRRKPLPQQVVDSDGVVHSDPKMILHHWKTAFERLYNEDTNDAEDFPKNPVMPETNADNLNGAITKEEVRKAIWRAKVRKAVGIDNISAEV